MKYTSKIVVNVPLTEFLHKFDHAENMKLWQKGLVSVEHVSGTPGMVGAKMKLKYKMGKRHMEMIETITHRQMPNEFHGTYSINGMDNMQENYFEETEEGHTTWTSTSEFLPLNFQMRAMLWMMPKAFKKQSMQFMTDFKKFAENGTTIANAKT